MPKKQKTFDQSGMVTPLILIVLAVFFIFATTIMDWALRARKEVVNEARGTQALQVAEAGIDYYKWHLAHNEEDYQDGNDWCCQGNAALSVEECGGVCGPYTKVYKDNDGNDIGEYSLSITPPSVSSTIVQIESKGMTYRNSSLEKTIDARLGKKSLARYSIISDSPIWIGEEETTSGPLHSNGGIRFDGVCDAEVTSAVDEYSCDNVGHGCTGTRDGVWGAADPDCVQYWSYPEEYIDFDLFTLDMAKIQAKAVAGGRYLGPSGKEGYHLVFNSNGTVSIYKIDSLGQPTKYTNDEGEEVSDMEGIKKQTLIGTYSLPANGVIFLEDNIWVDGTVNGRVTVAASRYAENSEDYARIVINNNIQYLAKDGSHVLGLMAEGDIVVPRHAPVPLNIDAVMLSQKGHVYVRDYKSSFKHAKDGTITVYGGIISNLYWTWSYVNSNGNTVDGYSNTDMIYDNNLTFSPPPSFPTEENYEILDWSEK